MTITAFRVQNFMGFRNSGWVELRPITLLFGRNSSGKSALLRALLLLKQTIDNRSDSLIFSSENGFDFGDYEENVFGHDSTTRISFGLRYSLLSTDYDPFGAKSGLDRLGADSQSVTMRLVYGHRMQDHTTHLTAIDLYDGKRDVIIQATAPEHPDQERQAWRFQSQFFRVESKAHTNPFPFMRFVERSTLVPSLNTVSQSDTDKLVDIDQEYAALPNLLRLLSEMTAHFFSGIDYISPLRSEPQRFYYVGGMGSGLTLHGRGVTRDLIKGDHLKRVNQWLEHSALRVRLEAHAFGKKDNLYEIRVDDNLDDPDAEVTTNIGDVGFGISQVLPIAAKTLLAGEGATVLIEQPELHLHPSAQADLGDLMIAAASQQRVTLLVETHSEHLLLRLRRRIVETTAGKAPTGFEMVSENFIAYFVDRRGGKSFTEVLKVNKLGEFESLPKRFRDFFADDLKELLALNDALEEAEEQYNE